MLSSKVRNQLYSCCSCKGGVLSLVITLFCENSEILGGHIHGVRFHFERSSKGIAFLFSSSFLIMYIELIFVYIGV